MTGQDQIIDQADAPIDPYRIAAAKYFDVSEEEVTEFQRDYLKRLGHAFAYGSRRETPTLAGMDILALSNSET